MQQYGDSLRGGCSAAYPAASTRLRPCCSRRVPPAGGVGSAGADALRAGARQGAAWRWLSWVKTPACLPASVSGVRRWLAETPARAPASACDMLCTATSSHSTLSGPPTTHPPPHPPTPPTHPPPPPAGPQDAEAAEGVGGGPGARPEGGFCPRTSVRLTDIIWAGNGASPAAALPPVGGEPSHQMYPKAALAKGTSQVNLS